MNTHIINKQVLELKVNSAEHAYGFQMQARDAFMSDVLPVIGEVLDEIAGPDKIIRIDRLELDLGTINPGRMATQMKERIREALLKQLPDLKQKKPQAEKLSFSIIETVTEGKKNKVQLMSETFSQRELLSIYFETGFLPWWAGDEIEVIDVDEIIVSLLKKEPVTTLEWLQQLAAKSPVAIRRMVLQLEKPTHKSILDAFPATVISTIQLVSKQLVQVKGPVNHFVLEEVRKDSILFTALILPSEMLQGTVNTAREILEALIVRLSAIYRTPIAEIKKQLYSETVAEVISSANQSKAPDLVDYFIEWEKKNPELAADVTGNDSGTLEIFTNEEQLSISELVEKIEQALKLFEEKQLNYLRRRKKAIAAKKNKALQPNLNKKVSNKHQENTSQQESIQQHTDKFVTGEMQEMDHTVSESSPDVQTNDPVKEVEQANTPGDDKLGIVKINWFRAENENSTPQRIPGKEEFKKPITEKPGRKDQEQKEITPVSEVFKPRELPAAEETKDEPAEQNNAAAALEQEDEDFLLEEHPLLQKKPSDGMTRFGGIILIAPFLPAFFSELKLIKDGKFTSEAEQFKALHLLNFIASGKTASPEYALLLHKLLCGIEITQPVPKTVKLTTEEKKEAMLFLDDIAEQWTALRSTSGKALRDTFFKRNGILEKKEKVWLLRVERGPMDIMLETLPWTISIIRAPWMQHLLQVEW